MIGRHEGGGVMHGLLVCLALLCGLITAPSADAAAATNAAERLVQRVTPEYSGRVQFRLDPELSTPTLQAQGDKLLISAPNVREAIRGYGYYLRHFAQMHLSWNGDNRTAASFPLPNKAVEVPPTLPLNFAFNYCTLSYTGAHWSRERWMQELDRLALRGFHFVLVTPGLEKVWRGFLADMGCPWSSIVRFVPHPCYSAWWNMGNLEGMAGPLPRSMVESEAALGRAIVARALELGLEPVLQGYVGLVPHDFPHYRRYILPQGKWCGYERPSVLNPTSPPFPTAAKIWYKRLKEVYGYSGKAFAGDLFHEGGSTKGVNLTRAAREVQEAMQRHAPGSIWFIQAWGGNPLPALLQGTSQEHTVILALHKNLSPQANVRRQYGGRRYVWCELANFGGNHGLYGGMELLEKLTGDAGGASGLGLLSEGVETNPLYYDLFFERLNTREPIDREQFLTRYARSRYNSDDSRIIQALHLLADSVYTPDRQREGCLENIMCARPGLSVNKASTWSNPNPYYDPAEVKKAGHLLLQAAQDHPELLSLPTFRYDLTDVCREVMANRARAQLPRCKAAYEAKDAEAFARESEAFCTLIRETAELVAAHPDFLLGAYLQGACARTRQAQERTLMRRALLTLLTTWRQGNSLLNDYANRQFSELLSSYYLPRWQAFFRTCRQELAEGVEAGAIHSESTGNNGEQVVTHWQDNAEVDRLERAFPTSTTPLLTQPQGDLLQLAERALR